MTANGHSGVGAGDMQGGSSGEPFCRICQALQSEAPNARLIRPCLCSGSQALVHLDCLNQWRATSSEAFYKCSICKYSYRMKRSLWAVLLTSPAVVVLLALLILLLSSFAIGQLLQLPCLRERIPDVVQEWIQLIISWPSPSACAELSATWQLLQCHEWSAAVHQLLQGMVVLSYFVAVAYSIFIMSSNRYKHEGIMLLFVVFSITFGGDLLGTMRVWVGGGCFIVAMRQYLNMTRFAEHHWKDSEIILEREP